MTDTCAQCGADFAMGDQSVQVPDGTICTSCTVAADDYRRRLSAAYEGEACAHCNGQGCGACHNTGMVPVTREQFFAGCLETFERAVKAACDELRREYAMRDEDNEYFGTPAHECAARAISAAIAARAEASRLRKIEREVAA